MRIVDRFSLVGRAALLAIAASAMLPGSLDAQLASPGWTIDIHATNTSTLSGGEALAPDIPSGNVLVKSLQDPAGSPVQLSEITPDGTVAVLATYPGLRNSDLSGIALDPLTDGVIVADEAGGRIALVDQSTLAVSTLFQVPWVMNPLSNGTGQQQYAPDPSDAQILYFWDSTRSRVFRLDRSTNALLEVLALDSATPDGAHIATFTNDVLFDDSTGTLLVTDGSSNSVLEVDPRVSPPTVTTLFTLVARPTAIAFIRCIAVHPSVGSDVFVVSANSIFAGPRSGGSLSLVASGFVNLADIVVGRATNTLGCALFAVDKALDTVYEIVRASPTSKDDCKDDGWQAFGFKNQGECIQFFNTGR